MKVLVTGANGLLGQKLSALLDMDNSIRFIATARGDIRFRLKYGDYRTLDITDQEDIEKTIAALKPDVVINTAAMTQVDQCEIDRDECWLTNATAVEYLVEACEKTKTALVHISTDFIFDGIKGPLTETAVLPNPINFYGKSKLAAEEIIMRSHIRWAIIRTVLVYGTTPDQSRSNIVLWVKNSLEQGKSINVVNDQWRTPTLAEDLAMGCYAIVKKEAKGIYNISGEEMMTPYDIALKTAKFFKLDPSLIHQTSAAQFIQVAKRPAKTGFIIDKAKKDVGYKPHTFEEGLAMIAAQLKK